VQLKNNALACMSSGSSLGP